MTGFVHDETRGTDYIQTYKGSFWPLDPREEDIDIKTIAHSLSNQCRFGGHSKMFYSVAQHCVECAHVAMNKDWDDKRCLKVLLHDASEAYIVDVPRPLKKLLPDYMPIESRIQKVIYAKFGIDPSEDEDIKLIDNTMLVTEASQLLYRTNGWWKESHWPKPYEWVLQPWLPEKAKTKFLQVYKILTSGDNN